MKMTRNQLPERTLGRSGQDLFSSSKMLTVIMIPFERFSPFAKAVDDLYESMDVPFNLIVIEGNAPESVRASLEKRRRKYKNLSIIYSNQQTSIGAAINLGTPHLKTPYAFIIDNDVRIPRGAMSSLLEEAMEKQCGIMALQNYAVPSHQEKSGNHKIQSFGLRTCFLISREALHTLGSLDETMTPFTAGIDIRMAADELGISICNETATCMELEPENFLWPMDGPIHSFQWNEERIFHSFAALEKKWGIHLPEEDVAMRVKYKKRDLENSRNFLAMLGGLFTRLKLSTHERVPKESHGFLLPTAA